MRAKLRIISTALVALGTYWLIMQHSPKPIEIQDPQPTATIKESIDLTRITYYQAVPNQTDEDPFTSSCGPNLANQVAVSRDLMGTHVQCGDKVQVWSDTHGYIGEFTVWDVTNARFTKTLDILTEKPYTWGKTAGHAVITKEKTP